HLRGSHRFVWLRSRRSPDHRIAAADQPLTTHLCEPRRDPRYLHMEGGVTATAATDDSFTVRVGGIPEPSTWVMMRSAPLALAWLAGVGDVRPSPWPPERGLRPRPTRPSRSTRSATRNPRPAPTRRRSGCRRRAHRAGRSSGSLGSKDSRLARRTA